MPGVNSHGRTQRAGTRNLRNIRFTAIIVGNEAKAAPVADGVLKTWADLETGGANPRTWADLETGGTDPRTWADL